MSALILLALRFLMALALYAFLGWAVYTLWLEIKRQSALSEARIIPEIRLTSHIGEQAVSHNYALPELLIGRDSSCDLVLAEKTVSAEHVRLSFHHGNWWVEDLNSRNGTYLNLDLLDTQAVLTSGDELQVGQVKLNIEIGANTDNPVSNSVEN